MWLHQLEVIEFGPWGAVAPPRSENVVDERRWRSSCVHCVFCSPSLSLSLSLSCSFFVSSFPHSLQGLPAQPRCVHILVH